jgi:hypothetical protein
MDVSGDDRGQAVQIGFVLIFGILIITVSIFQAAIVPNQNRTVEFNHYQEVRNDMTMLYTEIVTLGASSKSGQVLTPVTLGTRYPARLVFINPPPATGTIQSSDQGSISISLESSPPDTNDITDICGGAATTGVVYSPQYQESTLPKIRYDNGLLYVETADGSYAMLENREVVNESSKTINIYRVSGRLERKSEVGTLPIELTGTTKYGQETVNVSDTDGLVLPSDLPADQWNDAVLPSGITASQNGDAVALSGFNDEEYTVRCFTTGLGQRPNTDFNNSVAIS